MKTLLLLRHAKTESDNPGGDHERMLTKRGERDAAAIGKVIADLVGCPDAIVASDARRAQQTAAIVGEAVGFTEPITREPAIYGADWETLLEVVRGLDDAQATVLLVGHNPGFEELGRALAEAGSPPGGHLPTGGLIYLTFTATRWAEIRARSGRRVGTYAPD